MMAMLVCDGWTVGSVVAQSQTALEVRGVISGRVIDADSNLPLAGAVVTLQQLDVSGTDGRPAIRARTVTDSLGSYRFARLPAGHYEVVVERIGYLANTVTVEFQPPAGTPVSIGLQIRPVLMEPVAVVGEPMAPFVRASPGQPTVVGARRAVTKMRQRIYLASDARMVTQADVADAVTLGESDLFRAVQRMPGVATRDDYTATLWTRGAPWDQTRVYFDEMPLFNPTHTGWLFSAVNADGLGSVVFHPGVRSVRWGEGAAGVLDLQSRPGMSETGVQGSAEASLIAARLALTGGILDGRVGWTVAARRTYVDWFNRALPIFDSAQDVRIPYDFSDVIGRLDIRGRSGWALEASGLVEDDRVRGDIPGFLAGNRAHWGNATHQVTLRAPVSEHVQLRLSQGRTRYGTKVTDELGTPAPDTSSAQVGVAVMVADTFATLPAIESRNLHSRTSLRIESRRTDLPHRWAVGVELLEDTTAYDGVQSFLVEAFYRKIGVSDGWTGREIEFRRNRRQAYWAEATVQPVPVFATMLGLRVERGDAVRHAPRSRVAPTLLMRLMPDTALAFTAGWSRSYQYTQSISAVGGPVGPELRLGDRWVVANEGIPLLRSDLSVVGMEWWPNAQWLLSANAFHRMADGVVTPDIAQDTTVERSWALYIPAENQAYGGELSARRLWGRWTSSLNYAYGVSQIRTRRSEIFGEAEEYRHPSPGDVRHTVDLAAAAQVTRSLRVASNVSFATGVPYTRVATSDTQIWIGAPYSERTPNYTGVNAQLEYTRPVLNTTWTLSLQLRNLLGVSNAVTYTGTSLNRTCWDVAQTDRECSDPTYDDHFNPGIPRLVLGSIRVTF
jgi:hypothetical protein